MEDFLSSVHGILFTRSIRDMDRFPETWLEREVASVKVSDFSDREKAELLAAAKMAELIDDRKAWLLEEVKQDLSAA
jgi:hypothetical protein